MMTGPGSDMAGPVREVLATVDGLRVQLVTIDTGQRIPWHMHTAVSDTIVAVTGVVDVEAATDGHHLLQPGERWTIQAGTAHAVSGEADGPCRFLNLHAGGEYDFQPVVRTTD
jgi:quercetin dioxygenase-like cupin family protein